MRRVWLVVLVVLCVRVMSACASTKHVETEVVSAGTTARTEVKASQKKDPSLIYGDESLNRAYADWAAQGYPVHPDSRKYDLEGKATWYGPGLNGNKTASGEVFDMYGMTAAHKHLPFGTIVLVTNEKNGKSVVVRINDRGPFTAGRIIDLSYGAAYLIDMIRAGVVPARVEIIRLGNGKK